MIDPTDIDIQKNQDKGYFSGQLLIAMPQLQDSFFARALVYICAHNEDGAMGIMLNKQLPSLTFPELLDQLEIEERDKGVDATKVHFGGPVETARGFVLHTLDYEKEGTQIVNADKGIAITTTVEVLKDIAAGRGPEQSFIALGYAGWSKGQLEDEIQANGWLSVEPDEDLLFGKNLDAKWKRAMEKLGISIDMLTTEAGEA